MDMYPPPLLMGKRGYENTYMEITIPSLWGNGDAANEYYYPPSPNHHHCSHYHSTHHCLSRWRNKYAKNNCTYVMQSHSPQCMGLIPT